MDKRRYYTLPELLVRKIRLSWYIVTGVVALLLLLGLIIAAFAEKTPIQQLGWDFWRVGLQGPAIIIYILAIYPILTRMGDNAVESIKPLINMSEQDLFKLENRYRVPSRIGEWLSLFLGILFILILSQPWRGSFQSTSIFLFVVEIVMFGLLAMLIYYGFHNSRYLTMINKNLKLDIFSLDALAPIARWSLSVSLAFIGGIIISIIFQTVENLKHWQVIFIYLILVISTIAIFFISLWSTHITITKVKKRELVLVQKKFTQACRELTLRESANNESENTTSSHYEVAAWGLYERRIREIKEWPYSAGIIGRLVLSIVSPAVVYVLKLFSGGFFGFY